MATENLEIKVSMDTTEAEQGVKKLKTGLAGVGGSSKEAAQSAEELAGQIEQIRNMNAFELLGKTIDTVKGKMDTLKTSVQAMKNSFQAFGGYAGLVGEELAGVFNFKGFKEGGASSVRDYAQSIGIQLKEAFSSAGGGAVALKGAITALGSALTIVAGIVAAAVAVLGLLAAAWSALALSVSKTTKEINTSAAKIGMTTQAYQEWGYVLETVGVQADELSSFIKTLSDEQAQIKDGAEGATNAFNRLGLSTEKVVNMGQQELFTEVVNRLQQVENVVERTAIAYQIFGEDAAHLANVMNMSSAQTQQLIKNYNELGGGTSQNLINKSNQLQMAVGNLSTAWTSMTNNLAEAIMPVLTPIINWFAKAIAVVSLFFKTIFNLDSSPAAQGGSSMASGMQDYTSATEGAAKAVEKLKRVQMGFDELNVVSDPNAASSSGGTGAGGGIGSMLGGAGAGMDFEVPEFDLSGIRAKFEEYKTIIEDITTFGLIGIGVLMAVIGFMSGNLIMAIAGIAIAGLGISVGMGEGGTWERLGNAIMDIIDAVGKFFEEFFKGLGEWITDVGKWFVKLGQQISVIFTACVQGIISIWNRFWSFIGSLVTAIGNFFVNLGKSIGTHFLNAINNAKNLWNNGLSFFASLPGKIVDFFKNLPGNMKKHFQDAWTGIKNIFAGWSTFFSGLWNSVTGIFKKVGTAIGDAVGGSVKGVVNSIFKTIETRINSFIKMINSAISAINKIPGVNIGKVKEVSLPRLATGGIVTKSTIANIGEAGAEAVLPLENNTQWMDKLADKIASRNASPSKIVLQIDGRELGWASINGINGITKQTGNLQLQLI